MTIAAIDINSGPYIGNGLTNTYSYDFPIEEKSELAVYYTPAGGTRVLLLLDVDYTVTGAGNAHGGTISLVNSNLATGAKLFIRSNRVATQETDFASQGGFFPDTHEDAFDKVTMLIQQLLDRSNRSVRTDDGDPDGILTPIPDRAIRAGMFAAYDASGNPTVASGTGADAGLRADLANPNIGDILIAVRRTLANAAATDLHKVIEAMPINVVADYLVDNTGVGDATVNINKALAASANRDVIFPAGNYKVSGPLYTKSNSRIIFEKGAVLKPVVIADFEILSLGARLWGYAIFVNENWQASSVTDVNIEYIGVTCQPTLPFNGHLILTRKARNVHIHGGRASSCASYCATLASVDVDVRENWSTTMSNCAYDFWEGCTNVIVERNVAVNSNCGVNINSTDTYNEASLLTSGFQVLNNVIFGGPAASIFVSPLTAGSTIADGLIQGNYVNQGLSAGGVGSFPNGIVVQRSTSVSIVNNTLDAIGSLKGPIIVSVDAFAGQSENCLIADNKIINSVIGGNAYISAFGTNHTVRDNTARNSSADIGIIADSPNTVVVNKNMVGATLAMVNQTSTGTPTPTAIAMRADTFFHRFQFDQDIAVSGGVTQSTAFANTATGTNLATAFQILDIYSTFTTVASGTGAVMPVANLVHIGKEFVIWNDGANALTVYARAGDTIGGSGSISVAAGSAVRLVAIAGTLWKVAP